MVPILVHKYEGLLNTLFCTCKREKDLLYFVHVQLKLSGREYSKKLQLQYLLIYNFFHITVISLVLIYCIVQVLTKFMSSEPLFDNCLPLTMYFFSHH